MPEVYTNTTPGVVVEHYKGTKMKILHRGRETTNGSEVITYVHLEDGSIWTRPSHEFNELVVWPDGVQRRRFVIDVSKRPVELEGTNGEKGKSAT